MSQDYSRIPDELKQYSQFVVWRYEQTNGAKPTKVPYDAKTGLRANIQNPVCWASFETAVATQANGHGYSGIGFCLSPDDPFVFIDLDNPEGNQNIVQSHNLILQHFSNTYEELSPSGMGIHIIGKGTVPKGCRRHKVEVYSSERYMTMTGNVYNAAPIVDVQPMLSQLYADMGGNSVARVAHIVDQPEGAPDSEVWMRAANAVNGELFQQLWAGNSTGYTSPSEADYALVDILQFYSKNIEQIARMFRSSPAGQRIKDGRVKSDRDDYVMGMVAKSFDRASMSAIVPTQQLVEKTHAEIAQWRAVEETSEPSFVDILPNGIVSDIASYIYHSAPYPLAEGAILGGLALISGIAGRTYNVLGDMGLNQYLMLLATSGTGKEAIKDGIMRIVTALGERAHGFIGPGHIASAQAMNKYMATQQRFCLLTILPEFGPTMRSLAFAPPGSNYDLLQGFLLRIYTSNGRNKMLGEMIYSDTGKNTIPLLSPSLTILTEAEPLGFFRSFDRNMISNGLIPRFTMIEYKGNLPALNYNRQLIIDPTLLRKLAELIDVVKQLSISNAVIDVQYEPSAHKMLDDFNNWARQQGFNADPELQPLWNRAHGSASKIAAVLALRDPHRPMITLQDADFAVLMQRRYIETILRHLERGEIGEPVSEVSQEQAVYDIVAQYIKIDYKDMGKSHKERITPEMKRDLIISRAFLQMRTSNIASFRAARAGYRKSGEDALKVVINRMIDAGDLSKPLNDVETKNIYGSRQVMYKIENVTAILNKGNKR